MREESLDDLIASVFRSGLAMAHTRAECDALVSEMESLRTTVAAVVDEARAKRQQLPEESR